MGTHSAQSPKPARGHSVGLGLLALAAGTLLAGLVSKGCATPAGLGREAIRCPEPARSLALTDRRGHTVALVAPDGRSISLAPAYTARCRSQLGDATCAGSPLALDQGLQQRARDLIGRGLRVAHQRLVDRGLAGPVSGMLVAVQADGRDVLVLAGLRFDRGRTEILTDLPRRDLGTAFKPLLAAAAIASGRWTPDSPIQPEPAGEVSWVPRERPASGPITLREALRKSICCPTVRLATALDPGQTKTFLRDLGLVHGFPSGPAPGPGAQVALALDADLLEVTNAYATLAAHGWSAPPRLVLGMQGDPHRVLGLDQVTDLHRMLLLTDPGPGQTIGLPGLAGHRGTTPDGRDGWFIGYKSGLAVGVWFGLPPDGQVLRDPLLARLAQQVWLRFLAESMTAG